MSTWSTETRTFKNINKKNKQANNETSEYDQQIKYS